MQRQIDARLVRVAVEMLDPLGVEAAGAADDAVDGVPLRQQQLGQRRTILPRDPGDQGLAARPRPC